MKKSEKSEPSEISQLLDTYRDRPDELREKLFPLAYKEMHEIGQRQMWSEGRAITLQPTMLANETYMRLLRVQPIWKNSGQFLAFVTRITKEVAIDYARRRATDKRGGAVPPEELDDSIADQKLAVDTMLSVRLALRKLHEIDPVRAGLVNLIFFEGLTVEQAAEAMGLGQTKAKPQLKLAKAWLARELGSRREPEPEANPEA